MKLFKLLCCCVLIFGVSLNINAQDLLQYVPKDITFLAGMNPNRVKSKVDMDRIKKMDFYTYLMDEFKKGAGSESEMAQKFISNPEDFGLGIYDESFLFIKINDDESMLINYIFRLADQAAFQKFLDNEILSKNSGTPQKLDGYTQLKVENDEAVVAWTDKVVLVTIANKMKELEGADLKDFKGHIQATVNQHTTEVLKNPRSNSILTNGNYLKAIGSSKNDAYMWIDYGYFAKFQEMMGVNQDPLTGKMMEQMGKLYEDNYLLMGLNFLNGTTSLTTKYIMNGEMANMMKGMTNNTMNPRFGRYLAKDDMLGYYGMSINIEGMVRGMAKMFEPMMEEAGVPDVDQMVEMGASEIGLNMSATEIYNIFEGDMMLSIGSMREFEKEVTTYEYDDDFNRKEVKKMKKEALPGFTALMTYNDENALMPLIQMGVDAGMISKSGTHYNISIPSSPMDMYMALNNGMIILTNDANMMGKKMLKKGLKKKNRIGKKHLAAMATNSQVIFWDINKTLKEFGDMAGAMGGAEGEKAVNLAKQNVKDMWITSGKVKNGMLDTDMNVNFTNGKVNSLDQIFEVINQLFVSFSGEQRI